MIMIQLKKLRNSCLRMQFHELRLRGTGHVYLLSWQEKEDQLFSEVHFLLLFQRHFFPDIRWQSIGMNFRVQVLPADTATQEIINAPDLTCPASFLHDFMIYNKRRWSRRSSQTRLTNESENQFIISIQAQQEVGRKERWAGNRKKHHKWPDKKEEWPSQEMFSKKFNPRRSNACPSVSC